MSDNRIILIPENPRYIPDVAKRERARDRFAEIAPGSDEVRVAITDNIRFFDCGGNFERIICPSCRFEIPIEWWRKKMDEDIDKGFKLDKYQTPCCETMYTLHELKYEWAQGFGQFALEAMNPNIGALDDEYREEFEKMLGAELRVIYQRI